MKNSKIEIRKNKAGNLYYVVIAANGEPLATSEDYTTKGNCKAGIDALLNAVAVIEIVDTTEAKKR